MYTVASAQLPEPPAGADRIFIAPNAVIVLDGASAFAPEAPDPTAYVDTLGEHLCASITDDPTADLIDALAGAIETTATALALSPGRSPSSTVSIARWSDSTVDLLVLGDSQITTPHGVLRDDRLDNFATAERASYRDRLRHGYGYDATHLGLLSALQAEQARHRNQSGGYWIAEADPAAARQALTEHHSTARTPWLILATDGAYKPLDQLGIDAGAIANSAALAAALRQCENWEANSDPDGREMPRSKVHDDKAIAVLTRSVLPH